MLPDVSFLIGLALAGVFLAISNGDLITTINLLWFRILQKFL